MLMFDFETIGSNPVCLITRCREAVYCRSAYNVFSLSCVPGFVPVLEGNNPGRLPLSQRTGVMARLELHTLVTGEKTLVHTGLS